MKLEQFFGLKKKGTDVKTEVMAGITTFFALSYIVFVNPNQIAADGASGWLVGLGADATVMGQIWNAVFISSIIAAVIGTLLMGFYANLPFAQACGMGLNSYFCTCFVSGAFFAGVDVLQGYQAGVVIIFLSGILFLILSFTGAREYIAKAMPECLKKSIPAGIGLFIAMIGLKNAGIIQDNPYTFVQFVDINNGDWITQVAPALVGMFGLILIAVLTSLRVRGNIIIGIFTSTILYYVLTGAVPTFDLGHIQQSFADFGAVGVTALFTTEAWSNAFTGANIGGVFSAIMLILTFCLVDMFDTIGTLYGTAAQANMLDQNGDPININQAMACDSIGTVAGAVLGTSTCTTYVESAAGVAAGGRTGLTSVVTAICLAACLVLSPLASIIPSCATAPALIFVGVLMLKNFSKVDMDNMQSAVPAFLALIMMPLTYSVANGIGIGSISYVLIAIGTGKFKQDDIVVAIISVLFIMKFMLITM
ncbi:MAG: NCS2 family permease [Eubacteriales bacterium]